MQSQAQASEVCYELHTLGWKAFQHLSAAIVGEVLADMKARHAAEQVNPALSVNRELRLAASNVSI